MKKGFCKRDFRHECSRRWHWQNESSFSQHMWKKTVFWVYVAIRDSVIFAQTGVWTCLAELGCYFLSLTLQKNEFFFGDDQRAVSPEIHEMTEKIGLRAFRNLLRKTSQNMHTTSTKARNKTLLLSSARYVLRLPVPKEWWGICQCYTSTLLKAKISLAHCCHQYSLRLFPLIWLCSFCKTPVPDYTDLWRTVNAMLGCKRNSFIYI